MFEDGEITTRRSKWHVGTVSRFTEMLCGKTALVTGGSDVVTLAAGSDLLVYDTAVMDPPGSAEGLYELHTTPKRIGEVATRARVKSLLLSHLTGRVVDHADEVMHSVQTGFKGEVRFAYDCMTLEPEAL